jgi:CubicO group peptidase (beta-lactamase class C family)
MLWVRPVAALFALEVLNCGQPQAADLDPRFHDVRDLIVRHVTEGAVPSIAVAAAEDGRIVWEEAFGLADMESGIPATVHTMYRLGSIAKTFTATGLMTLVEQGRVRLDAPVGAYLPAGVRLRAFEGTVQNVTVRHLLNHRAGLPSFSDFVFADEMGEARSFEETVRRYGIVTYPPGDSFVYSNLGYQLAAHVITSVTGTSYGEYIRETIFRPLEMRNAAVLDGNVPPESVAVPYTSSLDPIPPYTAGHPGSSDIIASVHDLIRFAMFHLKDHLPDQAPILADSTIDAMQEAYPPSNTRYGLGWSFDVNDAGYRSVYHGGEEPGADVMMRLIPAEDVAVVVACNAECASLLDIQEAMVGALVPEIARIDRATSSPSPEEVVPPGELFGTWRGRITAYDRQIEVELTVAADGAWITLHDTAPAAVELSVTTPTFLLGMFSGSVPTPDNARHPYRNRLAVVRQEDRLYGQVTSVGWWEARGAEYELSSRVEFRRRE